MIEIEVKIPIDEIKKLVKKIENQGAVLIKEKSLEKDIFYDFSSQDLQKKHQANRLRARNGKTFLTFKGAKQKSRKFKIREEFETEVKNRKHTQKILKALGLKPVFNYQKYRTIFRKKKLLICLDETPAGNYLELEGQQSDIVKFAKALDFSKKEFIKADYVQLIKKTEKKNSEE